MASNLQRLSLVSDAVLVARAAAGDSAAYGALARRHGAAVVALLRRMGAPASLAEDLAQDAFMAARRKLDGLRDPAAFAPWIRAIAARLYVRRWRADARLVLMAEPPEPPQSEPAPTERLDLDRALASLTPAQRLCLGLCYGADLSQAEVAAQLNIPLGTVKSHVKRGLDALRARLAAADAADQAPAPERQVHG